MAKVAFLGLGVMGYPMAGHLKNKGGHEVTVYNRTAAKAEKWVAQYGGKSAPTPKAAAEGQDFVMACVGNDNDLREVTLGANGAFAGMGKGKIFVDHTTASAEIARELYAAGKKGRLRLHRWAGVGRPGRRRERRAHRDVRRRRSALRARQAGDRRLCARLQPDRRCRRRPAHQDGQPDLHRRTGAGPVGGAALRQESRPRHREGDRHHLQGRRAVLADGKPLQDHDGWQVRLRLRGGVDAQGPVDLPRRGAPQRRAPAGRRAGRSILRAGAGDGRQRAGIRRA